MGKLSGHISGGSASSWTLPGTNGILILWYQYINYLQSNFIYLFISVHQKVVKDIAQKAYEAMVLHQHHQLGTVRIVQN